MPQAQQTADLLVDETQSLQTLSLKGDDSSSLEQPDGPAPDTPGDLLHERFKIGDKLGEGGMGVVYRARDTRDGADVALKLMKGALAGSARRRFEREFRSLATLKHPHCLRVFDYGEIGGGPFFTMELFVGRPITSLAGRSLPEMLDSLLQLTHALDYIHGHGIVHRDVKPSNILVRPTTRADGSSHFETRLMDFGLAKYYGVKTSLSAEAGFVGTLAYCAPEQINLDELDHRADLYCLGLVGYELLSGRYVFPEARLAGMRPLIQAHLNDKPRPLSDVNPEIPAPIAESVMKYLRKQPRRRPDSAAALRSAIAGYLGIDERSMVSGVSIVKARPGLSVTGFVCRTKEQEVINDVIRSCLRASGSSDRELPPSLVVVSGEPGIGKSSVVQEAERIARGHGCQVYEGRCFDGNLSPFQPFVEIIRQLIAELRLQERREAVAVNEDLTGTHVAGLPAQSFVRLLAIVNDYSGELLRIAPELRKYLPGEAYRQADYGREADYIYRALSAFFLEIATLQPICLSFEDLQWADNTSLDLLRHLAAAAAEARSRASDSSAVAPRLVIVASARTGFDQLEKLITQLRDRRQVLDVRLDPLVESETRELIALRLNCLPEELSPDLVARVHAICGGNPFFVAETVRDWYEKEVITRSEIGWVLSTQATDSSDLPETVRDVMRLRLQGLPAKAQQVVAASAVIGAVVDIDLLREVLPDLSESDVLDAVDLLLPRRVFRETGNPGQVEFVHDLLRELPYADLSATRRQSLHRRVGERLENRRASGKSVAAAVLAEHFRIADERTKAFAYTVEAAGAALDAYAFNNAIGQLDEARKLLPAEADAATRYKLGKMLGMALGCSGRPDDAIAAYTEAVNHADDRVSRSEAQYGIGENYHRKGQYNEALRRLDLALKEAGFPRPASMIGTLFDTWKCAIYVHCAPRWLSLSGGRERSRRLDIAFSIYRLCSQILGTISIPRYTLVSYKLAALAKQTENPEHLAVAYSKFAINIGAYGLHRLSRIYIDAALKAVATRPRDVVWARTMAYVGTARYLGGDLGQAEVDLCESIGYLGKTSDYYESFCHHWTRHIHSVRGDVARELIEAEAEISLGKLRGDEETLSWGYYGKANALARAGRVDEAQDLVDTAIEKLKGRHSLTVGIAHMISGFVRIQASDYRGARVALEHCRSFGFKAGYLLEWDCQVFVYLVESLLGARWADGDSGTGRSIARRAWREARVARLVGRAFPNYYAHALRVSGRAAYALGKTHKAAYFFERSIVGAENHGNRYDLARALLDASRVIPEKADEYRLRGQQILDELGAVVPEAERIQS